MAHHERQLSESFPDFNSFQSTVPLNTTTLEWPRTEGSGASHRSTPGDASDVSQRQRQVTRLRRSSTLKSSSGLSPASPSSDDYSFASDATAVATPTTISERPRDYYSFKEFKEKGSDTEWDSDDSSASLIRRAGKQRHTSWSSWAPHDIMNFSKQRSYSTLPVALWSTVWRRIPKKFSRLFLIGALISVGLLIHVIQIAVAPVHHAPYTLPKVNTIVHNQLVTKLPEPSYELERFQPSPLQPATDDRRSDRPPHPWMAGVICAAVDVERRMLIRSTWKRLYRDVPFDVRFVVSNPGARWMDTIRTENRTFGDMIVLDHIPEDSITSHTVKTIEMYKWLISRGIKYEFVSKVDSDLWLNARLFWDKYLIPRLTNVTGTPEATVDRTIIGELYYSKIHDLVFPHGSFYTYTWDMVELMVELQDKYHVVAGEDMTAAVLMLKGRQMANVVNFNGLEKFDFDSEDTRGDGSAWARKYTHPNATRHALTGSNAIVVHQLKDKEMFLKVADCFDEYGIKPVPPKLAPEPTPSWSVRWHDFLHGWSLSSRYETQFGRIPDFFWSYENGSWICDGIWNMGKTRSGFTR